MEEQWQWNRTPRNGNPIKIATFVRWLLACVFCFGFPLPCVHLSLFSVIRATLATLECLLHLSVHLHTHVHWPWQASSAAQNTINFQSFIVFLILLCHCAVCVCVFFVRAVNKTILIVLLTFGPIFHSTGSKYNLMAKNEYICILHGFFPIQLSFRKHYFKARNLLIRFFRFNWCVCSFPFVHNECGNSIFGKQLTFQYIELCQYEIVCVAWDVHSVFFEAKQTEMECTQTGPG